MKKNGSLLLLLLLCSFFGSFTFSSFAQGNRIQITGQLTDRYTSEPIIGATIMIKGTVEGTVTDIDGNYQIQASVGQTLEYRYIGYNTIERTVEANVTTINVEMDETDIDLDEVVVIGYGQQRRESVVSSISSVGSKELRFPNRNLTTNIAGQVAGVIAVQRSGEPGNDDASFWIRGVSSFAGGTNPLVRVDGIPRSMSGIDVEEIEQFNVLKDAAATAVYGAEGANGVILITTKRGAVQKTQINVNAQYGMVTPQRMPELINSYDYLSMYNEGLWNTAGNPGRFEDFSGIYSREVLEMYRTGADPDLYPTVNWMDLLREQTDNKRFTINMRGGNERAKFFVSGAYYTESGIFTSNPIENYDANIGLQRYNIRSNIDLNVTETTQLSLDLSGQYSERNNPGNSSDAIFSALTLFPVHHIPMYYSDGTASDHKLAAWDRYNPYNLLNHSGYQKRWNSQMQTRLALEQRLDFITRGLYARGILSFDAEFASGISRSKSARTVNAIGREDDGTLVTNVISEGSALSDPSSVSNSGSKNIYLEASLNYNRLFDKHNVTGLLLFNQKERQTQIASGISLLPYRKQNIVGRASYEFDSKYMLEASFGATGSENFMKGNRWGIFPSIGGAWYVTHEDFMEKHHDFLSKLKLRVSYGIAGNDVVGGNRFTYREQLASGSSYSYGINLGDGGGASNGTGSSWVEYLFAAPNLTWETESKFNTGIDLGLLRGRIDLAVDYFHNIREDILMQRVTIPTASGFRQNPYQNFGRTENRGIESALMLNHSVGRWNFTARGNFTYSQNKVLERDEIPQLYDYMNATGQPINQPRLYIADGLYTPDDFDILDRANGGYEYHLKEHLAKPSANVSPGDIKYRDLNGDGIIDSMDRTYVNGMYPSVPQIVYGFGLNVDYRNFSAGIFFQGVGRTSANLLTKTSNFIPFHNGVDNNSARTESLDRWTAQDPYNQDVLHPRVHENRFDHNLEGSTWWYRDASFLRLKNVEFSYLLDKKVAERVLAERVRIFVQGMNLAVWDNIKYWDPELGGANSGARYPLSATWTFGLEMTF